VTGWLLDTTVLSELRRPRPNPKVVAFITAQPLDILYVSSVTLAEIRFGIELVREPGRRAELNTGWRTGCGRCSGNVRYPLPGILCSSGDYSSNKAAKPVTRFRNRI
jgi:hypothetical protein